MARRVLSGIFWGVVVAGLGLGGLSLLYSNAMPVAEMPVAEMPDPEAPQFEDMAERPLTEPAAPVATEERAEESAEERAEGAAMPQVSTEIAKIPTATAGEPSPELGSTEPAPVINAEATPAPEAPEAETAPAAMDAPASPEVQAELGEIAAPGASHELPQITNENGDAPSDAPGREVPALSQASEADIQPEPSQPPAPPASPTPSGPAEEGIGIGTPAGPIGNLAENVTTDRLPSIGQGNAENATADTVANAATGEGALQRNSQSFENPESHPVMAVILRDMGADRSLLGDLKNLPFALSFIVDAAADDAAEAISFYRNAGAEVVLSVPMPAGATPADAEVVLQAYAPLLDKAVAMMAPKDLGFQTLGVTAAHVAVVLAQSGHGLITMPQGLNTGHKVALKEGVAAGLVFRELDNDGQSGAVIRRFMDNAAFKARVENGVIMLGHARMETIQALIEWSLGNRAQSVVLAPVSAILANR